EIFADVIGDMNSPKPAPATPAPPAPRPTSTGGSVERRLEETLSGVMPGSTPRRPTQTMAIPTGVPPAPAPRPSATMRLENLRPEPPAAPPPVKRATTTMPAGGVDKLLSDTLSGPDISGGKKKR